MWQVGDRVGRFRLDRMIGEGSHGVVYAATDTALDAPVAVKLLHPWLTEDVLVRDRFKRELLLARRVAHPGVCRLFDLHEDGEAFFVMVASLPNGFYTAVPCDLHMARLDHSKMGLAASVDDALAQLQKSLEGKKRDELFPPG